MVDNFTLGGKPYGLANSTAARGEGVPYHLYSYLIVTRDDFAQLLNNLSFCLPREKK